jgi:hypothetical protein
MMHLGMREAADSRTKSFTVSSKIPKARIPPGERLGDIWRSAPLFTSKWTDEILSSSCNSKAHASCAEGWARADIWSRVFASCGTAGEQKFLAAWF